MIKKSEQDVVTFRGVTKRFTPEVLGLDNVSVSFERSRLTVLLGLSGSGKSTMLRQINGLQTPTAGTVNTLGEEVTALRGRRLRELRSRVGFIFQNFHLVDSMSVLENVCTGLLGSLRGPRIGLPMYGRQSRLAALEQLDRVGLADRAFQRADTLSGGQQQRVAIARALIQGPDILLADEPVASLDPESSVQVMELISTISKEQNLSVICSLHQVELALDFADRVVGLRSGAVVLDEDAAQLTRAQAMNVYGSVTPTPLTTTAPPSLVPALAS